MTFPLAFAIGFSVASIPGPTIILVATETLRKGLKAGLSTMMAPLILDALVMLPLGLFLQASLFFGKRAAILGSVGAAFLFWLGLQSLWAGTRNSRELKTQNLKSTTPSDETPPFLKGVLTHSTSPYPYLYWGTVGSSFVRQGFDAGGLRSAAVFPIGFWLGASAFTLLVIYLAARGRQLLPHRLERYLHYASGALLIGGGVFLGVRVWQGPP